MKFYFMVRISPIFLKCLNITNFLFPQALTPFINYILLMFKLYSHKSREKQFININNLIAEIQSVKKIKK